MDPKLIQQALFKIEEPKKELAKQESTPSESGDQLQEALAERQIKYLPPAESEDEDEQDIEIRQALRYGMLLVGIRALNMPTKEEKKVIIDFIKKSYGAHTTMELKLAFDLAVNGQLELDDAKCYENFSCEYIGRILTAYRKWAAKEVNWKWGKRTEEPEQLQIEQRKEVDWSDKWEDVKSMMREEGLKGLNSMIIATSIYDWLVRTGKLKLEPEDKKAIFIKAHQEYILELQTKINDKRGERQDYEDLAALRVDTWVQNPRLLSNAANLSKVIATKELAICEISAE